MYDCGVLKAGQGAFGTLYHSRLVANQTTYSGFSLPDHSYLNNASTVPADHVLTRDDEVRIVSGDRYEFSVKREVIETASLPLSRRWIGGSVGPGALPQPPVINLPEDGETVLALLLACDGQGFVPINSVNLVEAFIKAASAYEISLPPRVIAPGFFSPQAIAGAPLRYCALAWITGSTRKLLEASRYALSSQVELQAYIGWARATKGGEDVLLALSLTQLDREGQINDVVSWLPTNLKCADCQAKGRNIYSELRETVETVFKKPYPDLYSIVNPETWVSSVLSDNCPINVCEQWTKTYRFAEEDIYHIIRAAAGVRQAINPAYMPLSLQDQVEM